MRSIDPDILEPGRSSRENSPSARAASTSSITVVEDGRVKRDAMLPETCPACGVPWGDLADDHSAVADLRAAFGGRGWVVCQGTASAAEYAALDRQRRLPRGEVASMRTSSPIRRGRGGPAPRSRDRDRNDDAAGI
jgi:hypothetical protein